MSRLLAMFLPQDFPTFQVRKVDYDSVKRTGYPKAVCFLLFVTTWRQNWSAKLNFWCKLMCGAHPGDLGGPGGGLQPKI